MSKKSDILALLESGADYDAVQTETGAKRPYIRTVAAIWRKNQTGTTDVEEPDVKDNDEDDVLDIVNDKAGDTITKGTKATGEKTGNDYHKEWVTEKSYECECGCTLNRKATFCPHCGVSLDWSGF